MELISNCVFCGKSASEVARLIHVKNAAICEKCVRVCATILEREMPDQPPDQDASSVSFGGGTLHSRIEYFDPTEFREMIKQMGPSMIDSSIRQGLWMLWMALPEESRNSQQFTELVRHRYEHILSEFIEDLSLFGMEESADTNPLRYHTGELVQVGDRVRLGKDEGVIHDLGDNLLQ